MKVYGHPLSTCTRKVLFLLAEKGARAELVHVDLFAGEHKSAAHVARHPFGVIPVLDDDGFVLFESRAMLRYLDDTLEGPRLTPSAPRAVARMQQWLSVDQSYVAPHVRALAMQRIVRKHEGLEPDAAAVDAAEAALAHALRVVDAALASDPFLAGDALSLADVSMLPYVAALPMMGADRLVGDLAGSRRGPPA